MNDLPDHGITPAIIAAESGSDTTSITTAAIDAAVDTVRHLVGWHVWPERQERVTLDATGDKIIFLPTKRLIEVEEVIVDGVTTPGDKINVSEDGMIELPRAPNPGLGKITVVMRHGYDTAPNLRGVIIQMVSRANRPQEALNVGRISVGAPGGMAPQSAEWRTIDLYKLGPMP